MSPTTNGKGWEQSAAATVAGALEIAIFHPFDTAAKRLMSHKGAIFNGVSGTASNLNKVIFKKLADASVAEKVKFMYPGSGYAMGYKVLQRVYKFGGQPVVRDYINNNHNEKFKIFGKNQKIMTDGTSGCLIGIGEVVLLPLDRLKILSQTNPEALGGRSAFAVLRAEGIVAGYAGVGTTIARNAPGSFALFGGTAFAKDVMFGLKDHRDATFIQNSVASLVGSVLSITITNPMDVVKTRIQNKGFGEKASGIKVLAAIVKEEGPTAFFKGLTPKVLASAPKLVFAYTITEYLAKIFRKN
jgi:hypothetical protein